MWLLIAGWVVFCSLLLLFYHCCCTVRRRTKSEGGMIEMEGVVAWRIRDKQEQQQMEATHSMDGSLPPPYSAENITHQQQTNGTRGEGPGERANGAMRGTDGRQETVQVEQHRPRRPSSIRLAHQNRTPPVLSSAHPTSSVYVLRPAPEPTESDRVLNPPRQNANASDHHGPNNNGTSSNLMSFFRQLLTNLGVNLEEGTTAIFSEHQHDIVWIQRAASSEDALMAVHAAELDHGVTRLLNEFIDILVPHGLSQHEIEKLPRGIVGAEAAKNHLICTICYEPLREQDLSFKLHCQHLYHCQCLGPWLQLRSNCPTCRCPVAVPRAELV